MSARAATAFVFSSLFWVATFGATAAVAAPMLIVVEDPTLPDSGQIWGMSKDGTTVVGYYRRGPNNSRTPYRYEWASGGERERIGFQVLRTASEDGSVIISSGARWTEAGGFESLPFDARDISHDGRVIVGTQTSINGREAVRWVDGTVEVLGDLPGGDNYAYAYSTSRDGSVVVGLGRTAMGNEAFLWREGEGMISLGDLAGGLTLAEARGISADGRVVVGRGRTAAGYEAFRWTETLGMQSLGHVEGQISHVAMARATSADGSIIVGNYANRAFIWEEEVGMRLLEDVLVDAGLALGGFSLGEAYEISDSGRVIAGIGIDAEGREQGWIVVIPEPGSGCLLALGLTWLAARRR